MVVALSGAVGSGKSTVAEALVAVVGGERLSTRRMIIDLTGVESERAALQEAGDRLDVDTGFSWVADAVGAKWDEADGLLIVDAVRRTEQVDHLRRRFPGAVRHVHLVADAEVLAKRHEERRHNVIELGSYDEVRSHVTEAGVENLAGKADVVFDASRLDVRSVAAVALAGLGLVKTPTARLVDVVVGGQYGSEGKGNVCSYLAPRYNVLMRVGGPNAGHRVRDPDFDFVHLPSGSLHNRDARLLIGPGATLSLPILLDEIERAGVAQRLSIDPQAIIIEDGDIAIERAALDVIGSTKQGVGVATARKILNRGGEPVFGSEVRLARQVSELQPYVRSTWAELEKAYAAGERTMLEGTQGTDLSLHHGAWPHVTSRETTASGCMADAGIPPSRVDRVVMVVRTYPIRVGNASGYSGHMGREIDAAVVAERSGKDVEVIRTTEVGTRSGKPRRMAEFDLGQVRRAAALNGATEIALTFADYIDAGNEGARSFGQLTEGTRSFVGMMEDATGCPVRLIASGPHRDDVIEGREA
ncbi:adenylosuccinate synthetase [Sphingomonas sp. CFBP 13728]|uniref:adenylosuccinate synthetase n=1 Tax=Sphingomonas sp. CFBP 13728 TaxID=2775294 RepID=UPI0018D909AC|nr:adenylosuccinate synthetase [Sphingomonas sp. CFBP 13728]